MLLETCWRLQSPRSGRLFTCGIYTDAAPGLDVRVWVTSEDDLVRSQRSAEIGSARELAETWKDGALEKGFVDVNER